jgi:hypothetical protein
MSTSDIMSSLACLSSSLDTIPLLLDFSSPSALLCDICATQPTAPCGCGHRRKCRCPVPATAILLQSLVQASIRPCEAAVPLLFIVDVAALILAVVLTIEYTVPVHLVLLPMPDVAAVFCPVVRPAALDLALEELPVVVRLVIELEETSAVLEATYEVSLV